MADTGRSHDISELYRQLEREPNASTRQNIKRTIQIIKNESGLVRSMREQLIKAHRDGNVENIKDIHYFINRKSKYGQ